MALAALVGLAAVPVSMLRLTLTGQVMARALSGEPFAALLGVLALIGLFVLVRAAGGSDGLAVGACAISGGPYVDNPEVHNGCDALLPVDLYVPGCPPHPLTILDGLLRLLGRLEGPTR